MSTLQKRFCRRRELESLIGHLHHAYKVAHPRFVHFIVRITPSGLIRNFRRDLTWWRELFQTWDGLCFFCMPTWVPLPDFQVSSDAAGSLGYGAIFKSHWFYGAWSTAQSSLSIAYKELFPIVVAAYLWGPQWVSWRVEFLCDNEST